MLLFWKVGVSFVFEKKIQTKRLRLCSSYSNQSNMGNVKSTLESHAKETSLHIETVVMEKVSRQAMMQREVQMSINIAKVIKEIEKQ